MREILYPVFLACRDYTSDVFWKKIFENLAYGETPRGIYLKNNEIYSLTKKKEFNYTFIGKEFDVLYNDLYALLGTVYGLKSKGDMSRKRVLFDEFQKTHSMRREEDLWSKIKRKSLKDNLIQDYVLDSSRIYNLSCETVKKLYFFISVGCMFKLFSGNDIYLSEGFIKTIDGVHLSEGTFRIDRKFEEVTFKKEISGKKPVLYSLWQTYLKTL